MDIGFSVNLAAFDQWVARLTEKLNLQTDSPMKQAALDAMDVYMDSMRERFASASAGDGTWPPHAESTVRRRGDGAPILIESGGLQKSLMRDGSDHVLEVTDSSVIEGTRHFTARFHQDGTERMPARTILVPPDDQTRELMSEKMAGGLKATMKEAASG